MNTKQKQAIRDRKERVLWWLGHAEVALVELQEDVENKKRAINAYKAELEELEEGLNG